VDTTNPLGPQLAEGLRILSPTRQGRPEDLQPVVPRVGSFYIHIIRITKFQLFYYLCVGLKKRSDNVSWICYTVVFRPDFILIIILLSSSSFIIIMTESHSWVNFSFLATNVWIFIDYFIQNDTWHFCTFFSQVSWSVIGFGSNVSWMFFPATCLKAWSKLYGGRILTTSDNVWGAGYLNDIYNARTFM
jgi:hypothetical protein